MKQTLKLVRGNDNLRQIVGVVKVPSEATVSPLTGPTQEIADAEVMMERVSALYSKITGGIVGHMSVVSTTNEAREKPSG